MRGHMKLTKKKLLLIILPIIVLAILIAAVIGVQLTKEPILNGGYVADHIIYNGFKYFFAERYDGGGGVDIYYEKQENWAELDRAEITYELGYLLDEEPVYYDASTASKADLYLRVNEEWRRHNGYDDHSEAFVRVHIYGGPQTQR